MCSNVKYYEVTDPYMPELAHKKTADMDGLRHSPDDPYYRLGPLNTCLHVWVRETGGWDLFLGPLEWARAKTGTADRGVL